MCFKHKLTEKTQMSINFETRKTKKTLYQNFDKVFFLILKVSI